MDQATRNIITNKLGTLMMANAELAAENMELAKREKEHLERIKALKTEVDRLMALADQPCLPLPGEQPANGVGVH